jgi:hypothetical protein
VNFNVNFNVLLNSASVGENKQTLIIPRCTVQPQKRTWEFAADRMYNVDETGVSTIVVF